MKRDHLGFFVNIEFLTWVGSPFFVEYNGESFKSKYWSQAVLWQFLCIICTYKVYSNQCLLRHANMVIREELHVQTCLSQSKQMNYRYTLRYMIIPRVSGRASTNSESDSWVGIVHPPGEM